MNVDFDTAIVPEQFWMDSIDIYTILKINENSWKLGRGHLILYKDDKIELSEK